MGIKKDSASSIKRAFRTKLREFYDEHPVDSVGSKLPSRKADQVYLRHLCWAYEILSDKVQGPNYMMVGVAQPYKEDNALQTLYGLAAMGQAHSLYLKFCTDNDNKLVINNPDSSRKRTPLYIASRNGHYRAVEILLAYSADPSLAQTNGSTPLHGASFYGHKKVVQMLLEAGASIYDKNEWGNTPVDEAYDKDMLLLLQSYEKKEFYKMLLKCRSKVDRVLLIRGNSSVTVEYQKKIIAKRYVLKNIDKYSKWKLCWHGTKVSCVESILKTGLRIPGEKDAGGKVVSIRDGHIKDMTWGKGIFVSESVCYSSNTTYAESITLDGENWVFVLECKYNDKATSKYDTLGNTTSTYEVKKDEQVSEMEKRITDSSIVGVVGLWLIHRKFIEDFKTRKEATDYLESKDHLEKILQVEY